MGAKWFLASRGAAEQVEGGALVHHHAEPVGVGDSEGFLAV